MKHRTNQETGSGLQQDHITVKVDETGIEVKATTRELRRDRTTALADAEDLIQRIEAASADWTAPEAGVVSVHLDRYAQGSEQWFAAIEIDLVIESPSPAPRPNHGWPKETLLAG